MYITIEGAEATGKSTQARLLADALSKAGKKVFLTKEPGSPHDDVCKSIRQLLLNPEHSLDRRAALLLFMADRAQHMQHVHMALNEGSFVISDRSSISSFIYYIAEERDFISAEDASICHMLDWAQQIAPDMCFICQADLTITSQHLSERALLDRIERKSRKFHENVHELFYADTIGAIADMMDYAPKEFLWTPATYANSIDSIANFMFDKVERLSVK